MGIIKAVVVEVARTALEDRRQPQSDYRGGYQGHQGDHQSNRRSIAGSSSTSVPTSVPTTVYREQRYPDDTKRPEGPQAPALYDEAPPLYHQINQSTSQRDIGRSPTTNHNRTIIREPMEGTNTDSYNHSYNHSSDRVTVSSGQYDDNGEFPGFGTRLKGRLADRLDEHASRPSRGQRREERKYQKKMLKEEEKHAKKMERYR